MQAGEHKFPFTCALPPNLPSSFESDYGHVRYIVKATLDRPWRFDQETKIPFTVVAPFDLNQDPRAKVRSPSTILSCISIKSKSVVKDSKHIIFRNLCGVKRVKHFVVCAVDPNH